MPYHKLWGYIFRQIIGHQQFLIGSLMNFQVENYEWHQSYHYDIR